MKNHLHLLQGLLFYTAILDSHPFIQIGKLENGVKNRGDL